jgi:hypothetical protein
MLKLILNKLRDPRTNWKYILILVILAFTIGLAIFYYFRDFSKEMDSLAESSKLKLMRNIILKPTVIGEIIENEKAIEEEITDKSLKETIIQKFFDYINGTEIEKQLLEAGIAKIEVRLEKIDVNKDGVPEYVMSPLYMYFNKPIKSWHGEKIDHLSLTGANWMSFYIYQFKGGTWKLIGNLGDGLSVHLLKSSNKGYFNLAIVSHMAGGKGTVNEFFWNGEKYELAKSTDFNLFDPQSIPKEYLELYPIKESIEGMTTP